MEIVTGFRNEPHITSEQDRMMLRAIFGDESIVCNNGNQLEPELVSNNEIHIHDGAIVQQGCFGVIARNTYDAMTIENGSQGMLRSDLIVSRYTKNADTGIENMELVVLKGEESETAAVDPAYTTGSIDEGDLVDEFPLFRINLNGITVTSIDRLATPIKTMATSVHWK